jgi:hypothetical protein
MVEIMRSIALLLLKSEHTFIPHKSNHFASKKNGHPDFAGWPLRRRTDEEIIRLIIRLTYTYCKKPANLN